MSHRCPKSDGCAGPKARRRSSAMGGSRCNRGAGAVTVALAAVARSQGEAIPHTTGFDALGAASIAFRIWLSKA